MGQDLNNDYSNANSKIEAFKTVIENKKNQATQKKEKVTDSVDKAKKDVVKQINEIKNELKEGKNKIKSEIKSQLEELLGMYKQSVPKEVDQSLGLLVSFFIQAAVNTKEKIKFIIIDELISTLGCSEEQSYSNVVNQKIYIKVKHVDLYKRLIYSPEDENAKYFYENTVTPNGQIPFSMNRELYHRLQSNQSFFEEYGQSYIAASGNELFNIKFVDSYVDPVTNVTINGDYFEVELNPQPSNLTSVSDFLYDYYNSIDIISFDLLSAEIFNTLFGVFDFSLGISSDELREQTKFEMIIKRMMGICSDPTKSIDVAGTAKLSDLDFIDDSFFEVSNQELRQIEEIIANIQSGVVKFQDCNDLALPINVNLIYGELDEIISLNSDSKKSDQLQQSLTDIANDPKWKTLVPNLGLDINLFGAIQSDFLLKLPRAVFKSILTPKVMLGFMIMVKAIKNEISEQLELNFDNLNDFLKIFKKFSLNVMRRITAIFVEELFKILKKNLLLLVETILFEIATEAKNKQLSMFASIAYILLVIGEVVVDYANCKSVIDEILKLLNLGLAKLNVGLPQFALTGARFLGGVSNIRSLANTIENLQKNGLPTGDAPDGGPNLMNIAMKSMIDGMNKEQAENGKTEIAIPPLQVFVPPLGAGPGFTKPVKGYGKSY
jgi:hypothetical protein